MKAIEKIKAGNIDLSEDEIIELLRINNFSSEYYDLLAASNALSRRKFGNRGYVFTQIGIMQSLVRLIVTFALWPLPIIH